MPTPDIFSSLLLVTKSACYHIYDFCNGADYFDLVLIHYPSDAMFIDREHLMTTWHVFSEIESIHHIGVSNFYEPDLRRLNEICETEHLPKPYANQIQMNIWIKEP